MCGHQKWSVGIEQSPCLSVPADTISACLWDFCLTRPALVWPDLEMALAVLRGGALLCPEALLIRPNLAEPCRAAASPAFSISFTML